MLNLKPMPLLSLPLVILLQSCTAIGSVSKPVTPDSFCSVASPIYISANDGLTDETAREILAHDKIGAAQCGWK